MSARVCAVAAAAVLAALVAGAAGCGKKPDAPGGAPAAASEEKGARTDQKKPSLSWNKYDSPADGFSIEFPPDWDRREGLVGSVVAAMSPQEGPGDDFRENVNIIVTTKLPGWMGLKEFDDLNMKRMSQTLPGFTVIESGDVTLNGTPAKWHLYSARSPRAGEGDNHVLIYMMVKDRRGYVVTCFAKKDTMPRYRRTFERIVSTFRMEQRAAVPEREGPYVDREKKFSITFPKDWDVKENYMGRAVAGISLLEGPDDDFLETVNIGIEDIAKDMTLDQYWDAALATMRRLMTGFVEGEKGGKTINGQGFKWMVYSFRTGQMKRTNLIYVTVKDGRAYVVTGTTIEGGLDKWRKTFEEIAATFKVEN